MSAEPPVANARYLAGLQCLRRAWLAQHEPERSEPATPGVEQLIRASAQLLHHARELFPGGSPVTAADRPEAVAQTHAMLADPGVLAIFDARLAAGGMVARIDVLERAGESEWRLLRVKSSPRVKEEYLDEMAFQLAVMRAAGIGVASVEVLHPSSTFVRGEGEIDWTALLRRSDVTRDASYLADDVSDQVEQISRALGQARAPAIEPSPHCRRPYPCRFWSHCSGALPDDWIGHLPGLRPQSFHALREAGAKRASEIPDDFPLTRPQRHARSALLAGQVVVSPRLAQLLEGTGPPSDYLDFEAITPEVPIYPGTSPYQTIPFQWSLHRWQPDGLDHLDYLAHGEVDPRREFAERLCEALAGRTFPVLVYSAFESTVLAQLADAFGDLAKPLQAIRRRLVDLLPIVRQGIYAPGFRGSFSLKRVAPTLSPGFGYEELGDVADGGAAASAFACIARQETSEVEASRVRKQLLLYCARDTEALAVLQRALREHAVAGRVS